MFTFALAKTEEISEILGLYNSLMDMPGCTWNNEYPTKEIVKEDIGNKALFVLKDECKRIAAVASVEGDKEIGELPCWSLNNPCDVARVGVAADKQNAGVGTALMQHLIAEIKQRGHDGIRLLVSRHNPAALALYEKLGFANRGETDLFGYEFFCYQKLF